MLSLVRKKLLFVSLVLISILAFMLSGVSCGGGDGGDSSRLVWKYATGSSIYYGSAAIATDGTTYVGTSWKWYASEQGISDPAAGHKLYAFNPDGTVKWTYDTIGEVRSTPAIGSDGTLYFVVEHGGRLKRSLCAVDSDGDELWIKQLYSLASSNEIQIGLTCPAIAADGTIYVVADGIFAFDAQGEQLGYYDIGLSKSSPVIGSDGTVYVMSGNSIYAFSADLTQQKWLCDLGGDCTATPAIGQGGVLCIGTENGKLFAVNTEGTYTDDQQRIKWACNIGAGQTRHLRSSPAIGADGTIYVGCETNYVYALESDGTLAWKFKTSQDMTWPSPVIDANGVLYIGNMAGDFYAIQTDSSGLAASPWLRYRNNNANTARY